MPRKSTKRCSLRRLFDAMNANHSGDVTMAEVTKAFNKAAGQDGRLTFEEMTKACRRTPRTRKSTRRGGLGDWLRKTFGGDSGPGLRVSVGDKSVFY